MFDTLTAFFTSLMVPTWGNMFTLLAIFVGVRILLFVIAVISLAFMRTDAFPVGCILLIPVVIVSIALSLTWLIAFGGIAVNAFKADDILMVVVSAILFFGGFFGNNVSSSSSKSK